MDNKLVSQQYVLVDKLVFVRAKLKVVSLKRRGGLKIINCVVVSLQAISATDIIESYQCSTEHYLLNFRSLLSSISLQTNKYFPPAADRRQKRNTKCDCCAVVVSHFVKWLIQPIIRDVDCIKNESCINK